MSFKEFLVYFLIFLSCTALFTFVGLNLNKKYLLTSYQTFIVWGASSVVAFYSDSACTQEVNDVSWGSIAAGSTSYVLIYALTNDPIIMFLQPEPPYSPANIMQYVTLGWNYSFTHVIPSGVKEGVELSLYVSTAVVGTGITNFSFDLEVFPMQFSDLDVMNVGSINIVDVHVIAACYGTKVGESGFVSNYDINHDGRIDIKDVHIESYFYGATAWSFVNY